jgi:hypothetical protein
MNRLNQILVGVLVLQLVVAAIVFWPRPTASGEDESLFPDVEASRITGLTITSSGGQTMHMAKRDGSWVLPDADDYPVLEDKVPPLLDKIVGLKADRLVTQTSGSHKRLKVASDDYERLVEFELDDGTRYRLYVGTSPRASVTHVRAEGQDEVYLTSDLSAQELGIQASAWVDRTYLDIPSEQIVALTLENENGRLELKKDGDTWTMVGLAEDETLDQASVTSLVNRAALTTMTEPVGKEEQASYGFDEPSAVVTIQTHSDETGDKTYTLRVGAQDPTDQSYYIISSESPYYVRVTEFAMRDLIEKGRQDLIELPPTPTVEEMPEATPTSP